MSVAKYKPAKKAAGKKLTLTKRRKSKVKRALIKRLGEREGKKAFQLAIISRDKLKSDLNVECFDDVIRKVYESRIAQALVRTSHAKYHEAISLALALYYAVLATENPEATLKRLIKETGQKPTTHTSAAQIVVQAVINYGETKKERQANRRLASRDAAAVRYLAERGIFPDEVVDLGRVKGEGLEAWAGAKPCIKPRKKASDANGVIDGKSAEPHDQSGDAKDEWDEQEQEDDQETSEAVDQNRTRQLRAIKEIARNGHVFFRAPDEDETWGYRSH